ncbi:cupin domain-containing protein [Mucilaginibacter aquaedulcis]|uniref:cupin domain-containing protein n=1 Tax=Mucilaginibacter aquaedulcis TaxID=1187081 RepID=UPI0025B3099C|nr:cupin domain-containing protein [Mucilaginibacter aquaedulcis]MDN3547778.1 cupin domain-containing protein [Mucilaginibacter aquaedulcis]
MKRHTFLSWLGLLAMEPVAAKIRGIDMIEPEKLYFKDDGKIPNSKYPLLLYHNAFELRDNEGADWLEKHFAANNWTNSWRNGVYSFHHYHSTSHEVLGVYSGSVLLHLGGEQGQKVKVKAGDIIVIPAGVGHKNLGSDNLGIVGAYPDGRSWDVNKGLPGERPGTDQTIAALPVPVTDPLRGKTSGLPAIWDK